MRNKVKQLVSILVIIVLLPYVITVFINGPSIHSSNSVGETYVKIKTDNGTIELPLDEYCIGVLAKEMEVSYEEEALKAQAVLVRTSLYKKIDEQGSDVIFEDSFWTEKDMEKKWGAKKYTANYNLLCKIWKETEGQVVTYEGKIATTPFHKLSNGMTRVGSEVLGTEEYPYIQIRECPEDVEADEQIQTVALDLADFEILEHDSAGYVKTVRVGGETCTGEEFRDTYHLASSCFEIQDMEGKKRITTKGVGHGLGMSQNTANVLAADGATHEEILQYFFEGTEIKEVAEILVNIE